MKIILHILISFFFLVLESKSNAEGSHFTIQREDYINNIKKILEKKKVLIINGLSGMGKTKIVESFFKKFSSSYKNVIWINWDKISPEEQVISQVSTIKLSDKYERGNFISLFKMLLNKLKNENGKFLIIIDNANNLAEIMDGLELDLGVNNIHILVTSRQGDINFKCLEVGPFRVEESVKILAQITKSKDFESMKYVANSLGNYPFYIVRIAQIITNNPTMNLSRVRNMLEKSQEEESTRMIAEGNMAENQKINKVIEVIGDKTIKEEIKKLKENNLHAFEILTFLSVLNGKKIPISLIHCFVGSEENADKALKYLYEHSFITNFQKAEDFITFDVHEITQRLSLDSIETIDKDLFLKKITQAFLVFYRVHFPLLRHGDKEDQFFFLHILKTLEKFEKQDLEKILPLKMLSLKRPLYSQREPDDAIKIYVSIEKKLKDKPFADDDVYADYLIDRAFMKCFLRTEDNEKFQDGINDAILSSEIYSKKNNVEGEFKAQIRVFMLWLYQGDLKTAKKYLNKADTLFPKIMDNNAKKEFYFVYSWYLLDSGDPQSAITYSLKGIEADKNSKNAYIGLYLRNNLATAYLRLGRIDEALEVVLEALAREENMFYESPSLVRGEMLQVQALCLMEKGMLSESEKIAKNSLKVYYDVKGKNRPYQSTAAALKGLGEINFRQGKFEDAIYYLEKSKTMFETITPDQGIVDFAVTLRLLCQSFLEVGKEDSFNGTYSSFIERFGVEHKEVQALQESLVKKGFSYLL